MIRRTLRASVALIALVTIGAAGTFGATIVVDTMVDAIAAGDGCSLREAIRAANMDAAVNECPAGSGVDTIELTVGAYTLAIPGAGEDEAATGDLDITDDLVLKGAGTDVCIIDGGGLDRVFHVDPDQNGINVLMRRLTIQGGSTADNGGGIATFTNIQLALIEVKVRANAGASGAGIYNNNNLILQWSEIADNDGDDGAGLFSEGGSTTEIQLSRIGGNTSATSAGGINNQGTMSIVWSLIDGNTATGTGSGGGIRSMNQLTVSSTTISGNTAGDQGFGGGIRNEGPATFSHVTVTDNTAVAGGGGIYNDDSLTLDHTILAANAGGNCGGPNAVTSDGFNLEDAAGCALAAGGDQSNIDPELGPLQPNGGPTDTHALAPTSPAVDLGDAAVTTGRDQRWAPQSVDGDGNGSAVRDVGAFELNQTMVVNLLGDGHDVNPGDGICEVASGSGLCTLRAAIQESNAVDGWQRVLLGNGVHRLTLAGSSEDAAATGDLDIADEVLIEGAGVGATVIDGGGLDRVFDIRDLSLLAEIEGLTVTGGSETLGGCIRTSVFGSLGLFLTDVEITGCSASSGGGALYIDDSALVSAVETTIHGNQAGGSGGAVGGHFDSRLLLNRSTVSGNVAGGSGGAMEAGIVSLFNSTITGNSASSGGGLFTTNLTATAHSTVASNTATGGEGGGLFLVSKWISNNTIVAENIGDPGRENCLTDSGTPITRGFNLDSLDTCGFGAIGDQVTTDPLLVPLADNGGATRTHAVLAGSPAIDLGEAAACPPTDQRGSDRPASAGCDIGAFEALECQPLVLEDHTIDETVLYEACDFITARNLTVAGSGHATLVAGRVLIFDEGFQVEGALTAEIDPSLGKFAAQGGDVNPDAAEPGR